MARKKVVPFYVFKYTGPGYQGMTDGDIHITGGFLSGHETLCGFADTFMPGVKTDEPVTCKACKEIYLSVRAMRNTKFAK